MYKVKIDDVDKLAELVERLTVLAHLQTINYDEIENNGIPKGLDEEYFAQRYLICRITETVCEVKDLLAMEAFWEKL